MRQIGAYRKSIVYRAPSAAAEAEPVWRVPLTPISPEVSLELYVCAVIRSSELEQEQRRMLTIMVFLHGTVIMHRNAVSRTRRERVAQVREREESVHDYATYVPVGNAVRKLHRWVAQGAQIIYLSSHRDAADVAKDIMVLRKHGFPQGEVCFRQTGETYQDIAERVVPDILIEDDCESIGGKQEMTYPLIRLEVQTIIKSIIVQEFSGIDDLPDDLIALARY